MKIEPSNLEIILTKIIMRTPAKNFYKIFSDTIEILGNEKILDFGSGYGTIARFISNKLNNDGELVCCDISSKWQIECRKYLKKHKNIIITTFTQWRKIKTILLILFILILFFMISLIKN